MSGKAIEERRTCKALTVHGKRCRAVVIGQQDYCTTHGGEFVPIEVKRYRCAAITSHGHRCRQRVAHEGGFCRSHEDEHGAGQNAQS